MPISPDIMARGVARDIQGMDANALAALRPAMAAAQVELEHDLKKWMALLGPNAAQLKYTPAHLRQVQLILGVAEGAASGNRRTGYPTIAAKAVMSVMGMQQAPQKAAQTLKHELEALAGHFADIPPPQLVHAAALAAGKNLVIDRYPKSAARYAGQVKDDLKLQFGIGLARGETIEQLTKRIANISTFKTAVDANHPEHAAKAMAAGLSRRYENWANRLVRTELVNSYNYTATQGIKKAHEMDDRVVMVWDAANDMRVCPACRDMHGRNIMPGAKGGFFSKVINKGVDYPPLHPYCRCAVVAWMAEWGTEDADEPDLIAPVPGQVEFDPDTFEPPPPPEHAPTPVGPLTPHVPELAEGLMAAVSDGDEGEVLEKIGKTITDSLNSMGLHKRDRGYDTLHVGSPPAGADAVREWNGKITMLKEVHQGMVEFLETFSRDPVARKMELETITPKELYDNHRSFKMGDGVRVAVHEHVHGYGPLQKEAYTGHGVIVEEVSTEVTARRIMRDQFGLDLRSDDARGSYQGYIKGMLDVIQKSVPNTSITKAWDILEGASLKFKSDPPLTAWLDPVRGWHETVAVVANPDNPRLRSKLTKAFEAKFALKK